MKLLTIQKPFTWQGLGVVTSVRRNGIFLGHIRNGSSLRIWISDSDFVLDVDDVQYTVRNLSEEQLSIVLKPKKTFFTGKYMPYRDGKPLHVFSDPLQGVNLYDDNQIVQLPSYVQHYAMCYRIIGADTLDEAILENGTLPLLRAVEAVGCTEIAVMLCSVHEQIPEADAMVDEVYEEVTARVEAICQMEDEVWIEARDILRELMYSHLIENRA